MEELFTIAEAQKLLKVSRGTLYNWMETGILQYVYVGGLRRITRSAIEQLIEVSTREKKDHQKNQEPGLLAA